MPRRVTGILICLLVSVVGWAQGESVLSRTDEFRTKVELAKALGIDTLTAFKMQWEHCRKTLTPSVVASRPKPVAERCEWIKIAAITRRLPQQVSTPVEKEEKQRMDSVYNALQEGASFETMAARYTQDGYSGKTIWLPVVYLLDEWNACISSLEKGEVSEPFLSPQGIHVIRWMERGYRNKIEAKTNTCLHPSETELREALLVASLEKKYRTPVKYTENDLEAWFKKHRKLYKWDLPRYKGVVVHCIDKKQAKRIRKSLKKMEYEEWKALADNTGAQGARMECGLYQIGENPYVDKLVFKCGEYEPIKELPYTFVVGKVLKKEPEDYRDIRDRVVGDYIEAHKDDWLKELKREESQKE